MREAVTSIVYEAFALVAVMGPYMLLGLAAAGALHVLLPLGTAARHLGGPGLKPIFKAVLLGVPLPICSCGVVPIAASLRKSGASEGATIGFLVTTPTTGVDSILATYSVLGGAFAALRVAATTVLGLVAGLGTALVSRTAAAPEVAPIAPEVEARGFVRKIASALEYAAVELFGGIARPFAIGVAIGGLITYFLPAGVLEQTIGRGFLSYAAMMAVGIPLYVCASGSIPLAVALIAKGLSPGAALVFLIAGPATNVATVAIVGKMLGRKPLAVYLATLAVGSVAAGYAADALFAAFPSLVPAVAVATGSCHAAVEGLGAVEIASGVVLLGLIAYHLAAPLVSRLKSLGRAPSASGAVSIRVPDMNCNHCVMTITNAVGALEGVRLVSADPSTKIVALEADSPDGVARAEAAIRAAGFHPEG
jgi:uncharacterized protein